MVIMNFRYPERHFTLNEDVKRCIWPCTMDL